MQNTRRFSARIGCLHSNVTGSCFPIIVTYPDGKEDRFIIDCGMFQNDDEYLNEYFPFNPKDYKFSVNTHVHVDHIGRYPFLVKQGFKGRIYTSYISAKLSDSVLSQIAYLMETNAMNESLEPIFTLNDANNALRQFRGIVYRKIIKPTKNISVILYENGHIFGACMVYVVISYPGEEDIILLFTGDFNNKNKFFDVPTLPVEVRQKYLSCAIVEATYGNIDSTDDSVKPYFAEFVVNALNNNQTLLIPSFALGRSQEVLHFLKCLQDMSLISKSVPIYLDGHYSKVYTRMLLYDDLNLFPHMKNFLPSNFHYADKKSRISLAADTTPKIIVAPGGYSDYGSITTYLKYGICRKDCSIFYPGYVSNNSTGWKLKNLENNAIINYQNKQIIKNCTVGSSGEMSAHIKSDEFLEYLSTISNTRSYLVNHGTVAAQEAFSKKLSEKFSESKAYCAIPDKCFVVCSDGIQDIIDSKSIF